MFSVRIAIVFLLFAFSLAEESVEDGRKQYRGRGRGRGYNNINVYHHFRRQDTPIEEDSNLDLLCLGPNNCRRSEGRFSNIVDLMKLIQSIVYVHEEQKKVGDGGGASKPGGGGSKPGGGGSKPGGGGSKPGGGSSKPGGGASRPGGGIG